MVSETRESGAGSFNRETKEFDEASYYKRLDGMADFILELRDYLEEHKGVIEDDEAMKMAIKYKDTAGLLDKDIKNILTGLKRQQDGREYINYLLENNKPEDIFLDVFGVCPEGRVEVKEKSGYLVFILDAVDIMSLERLMGGEGYVRGRGNGRYVGGFYLPFANELIDNVRLKGKVILISRSADVSDSDTKRDLIMRTEAQMNRSIQHEITHAISFDLFIPLLNKLVRLSRQHRDRSKQESGLLPYLNQAKDSYFAGDLHRSRFVSEFGPARMNTALRNVNALGDRTTVDEDRDFILRKYRQEFFILDDVLQTVHGQLDEDKLMALVFLLPADRIERLLHFVGIDPVKWKEEWLATHSDADLKQREEGAIIKFGR